MLEKQPQVFRFPPKTYLDFVEERIDFTIMVSSKGKNACEISVVLDDLRNLQTAKRHLLAFNLTMNEIYKYEAIKIIQPMILKSVSLLEGTEDRKLLNALNDLGILCQIDYDRIKKTLQLNI